MTTTQARRVLGLTERQMSYLLGARPELEPANRAGHWRMWTDADLDRVRASLAARPIAKRRPVS